MAQENETFAFLDFSPKIPVEILKNKTFIRIANLEEEHPLVQVNDMVFKGTYDHAMGTNLFFKEVRDPPPVTCPFEKPNANSLKFICANTLVINCKQMRIPPKKADLPENNENIQFNFNWDYQELLKKFEDGTLDLNDMIKYDSAGASTSKQPIEDTTEASTSKEPSEQDNRQEETSVKTEKLREVKTEDNYEIEMDECCIVDVSNSNVDPRFEMLKKKYENLQMLARHPVKREHATENLAECDPKYNSSYDYNSIKCKILERPLFSYFKKCSNDTTEDELFNYCIDLQRCVRLGLISPESAEDPKLLTDKERRKVLRMENFENIDLLGRYHVLLAHKQELENHIDWSSFEENSLKDEFGRTPLETLDIFRKLTEALHCRIQEMRDDVVLNYPSDPVVGTV